jgi:hypothetical protein
VKHHCDTCRRHVLVTWETWDNHRVCSGCIVRAVKDAYRVVEDHSISAWWERFADSLDRQHRGEVS